MLNTQNYTLPEKLEAGFRSAAAEWNADNRITRLWNKDASLWSGADESRWLDWLHVVDAELGRVAEYEAFAREIADEGFTDVLLMGMGGSSLCPEVLAVTFGKVHFHVLDSTDPAQIKSVESRLSIDHTLFIVASKSGSTLEPNTFKQYFFDVVSRRVGAENAGRQFVAITDPGSKMQKVAEEDGFRRIFFGNPEIGGRFSALSPFGMTAAAAMGLDTGDFLARASEMVSACRDEDAAKNPGVVLGLVLGICQQNGIDKMTVFTSPEIYDLGAWMEQLVAESTGKHGVSIIPVDREPFLPAQDYSEDRVFVAVLLDGADNTALIEKTDVLAAKGHPTVRIRMNSREDLGQEFFRWEFATAVAGAVMGINPFDQPDVESAKIETRKLTEEFETTGNLPEETPFFSENGISLFAGEDYAASLRNYAGDHRSVAKFLDGHIAHLQANDYFALLAYVEMSAGNERLMQEIREKVLRRELTATCVGFGPRFLHSTGQAYKGGANNGVFLQITTGDEIDFAVPGQEYTFGVVKAAQARGDFQVLVDRGRRALRIHFASAADLRKLNQLI